MTRQRDIWPYTTVFILTVFLSLSSVGCHFAQDDRQPAHTRSPGRGQVPEDEGDLPVRSSPTTLPLDNAYAAVREELRFGNPAEKEQALYDFRARRITELIPDVIDAIGDTTQSPRHGDTGWGFVGHQAAWMLADVAYKLDGVRIEDRGRGDYTFHDDMYKGGEALQASGRLKQVQGRWLRGPANGRRMRGAMNWRMPVHRTRCPDHRVSGSRTRHHPQDLAETRSGDLVQ